MRLPVLLLSGLSVALAGVAQPSIQERGATCIDTGSAGKVADNFKCLITNYSNGSADAFLTTDFSDYSDSVNELINGGCPSGPATLGSATFTGRTQFEAGQGSQPNIPFDILNVWHGCHHVVMRWKTPNPANVQPEQPVQGIIVMEVEYAGLFAQQPWLIKTVYSEFNSGAWLYDLGVFKPSCSGSQSHKRDAAISLPVIL